MNSISNGECKPGDSCEMMKRAIGGADEKAKTGIVQCFIPPHAVAVRCKTGRRGEYQNMIFRVCPWCGCELPQGRG